MELQLHRYKTKPFEHQIVGVKEIVRKPYFGLFDEMGSGKTKQAIDSVCELFTRMMVTRVIIVAPAAVRGVWFDPELGELAKHLWDDVKAKIIEYHGKNRHWAKDGKTSQLEVIVTNYDFIRSKARLQFLKNFCGPKTMLILDESVYVKNSNAQQTKACLELRHNCGRVLLMNGTPIANSPGDMFSQGNLMHPSILQCKNKYIFRSRYAILGGWMNKQVVKWHNLEDLQARFAPFVLRRLKEDCLKDLPEKMPPVALYIPLDTETWRIYKGMKEEMVSSLSLSHASIATQTITKVMRLSQIVCGFVGGVEDILADEESEQMDEEQLREFMKNRVKLPPKEISREKLNFLLEWLEERFESEPNFKCIVWSRFRPEILRLIEELKKKFPACEVGAIIGGQKKEDRTYALRLLDPRSSPNRPVVVVGNPQSGGLGLNATAAHTIIRTSTDYSLFKFKQAEDRIHRSGQTFPCSYYDLVATGPSGEKTIDHNVLKALLKKDDIAKYTTSAWLNLLKDS